MEITFFPETKEHTLRLPARLVTLAAVGAAAVAAPAAAPAAANAAYGAIAVNPSSGGWGISHSYNTRYGAQRRALNECPGSCRVLVWTKRRCGAVIQTRSRFIGGTGSTRSRAIRNARARSGYVSSRVVAWECSG